MMISKHVSDFTHGWFLSEARASYPIGPFPFRHRSSYYFDALAQCNHFLPISRDNFVRSNPFFIPGQISQFSRHHA
jgi:hypothetical protein